VAARVVVVIFLILCHLPASAETVEEVVAAVGETPILHSDIVLAELVELVEHAAGESQPAYAARLLDARINLELQFRDLEESGTLYRLTYDVASSNATLIDRAGGEDVVSRELEAQGLTPGDLEELSLRLASSTAYIEQRLKPRIRVTPEEIQTTYQDVVVAEMAAAGQQPPPLDEVRNHIRRLLFERKLNNEIEAWLATAAEQHEVIRFYRP
jgi:hypothetical protein